MTRIKFCGLTSEGEIAAVNAVRPHYAGFVFARQSRRRVSPEEAARLRELLDPGIAAVGVFVDAPPEEVAGLLNRDILDMAQLHGNEDEAYIARLRALTAKPLIRAFRVGSREDIDRAGQSSADWVLLDSGAGTGKSFDWDLVRNMQRPWFLAGGLGPGNVSEAVARLHPFAVDVSSGIETDGRKDQEKMAAFLAAVKEVDRL